MWARSSLNNLILFRTRKNVRETRFVLRGEGGRGALTESIFAPRIHPEVRCPIEPAKKSPTSVLILVHFDVVFYSAHVQESLEQTKFENDIKEHPILPELQIFQSINNNSSDSTTIAEKDRLITETIQQLQKFREQLIQDHRQQNKVRFSRAI